MSLIRIGSVFRMAGIWSSSMRDCCVARSGWRRRGFIRGKKLAGSDLGERPMAGAQKEIRIQELRQWERSQT
jgi:hypothetical protein